MLLYHIFTCLRACVARLASVYDVLVCYVYVISIDTLLNI